MITNAVDLTATAVMLSFVSTDHNMGKKLHVGLPVAVHNASRYRLAVHTHN